MDALRLLTRGTSLKLDSSKTSLSVRPSSTAVPTPDSKKRKRNEHETETYQPQQLTKEQIKQYQKSRNIKISDLHRLHDAQDHESKKARKDQARLYPHPLLSFQDLSTHGIGLSLRSNLKNEAYYEPTDVQTASIPLLLRQQDEEPDLLTIAPTGSGKTLAFLLPLINKLSISRHANTSDRHVKAIILAPTKELVTQIVNEGRKLAANTGVRISALRKGTRLHGPISSDVDSDDQESSSENEQTPIVKADILVSTPLTLLHALQPDPEADPEPLPQISNLILDEADVLLDPLFRDQTLALLSALTSPLLRISLWSATIGASIESLAITTITTRHRALNLTKSPPLLRIVIGLKDTSLPSISHHLVYTASERGKLTGLRNILHPPPQHTTSQQPSLHPPFLIFTQTIPRAQALHEELRHDIPTSRIAVLHAGLSYTQRHAIMTSFRHAKIWILITTDLLSRGVDFKGMNGVVNYDIPTTVAGYVHRAGRTGRQGRQGGVAVTFWTDEDIKYLRPIATVIRNSEKASRRGEQGDAEAQSSVPKWLINALPEVGKQTRKDLKQKGVVVRRAVKESDDKNEKRAKKRNVVGAGTGSGFEKRMRDRKREMIEGSRRRKEKESLGYGSAGAVDEEFSGFD